MKRTCLLVLGGHFACVVAGEPISGPAEGTGSASTGSASTSSDTTLEPADTGTLASASETSTGATDTTTSEVSTGSFATIEATSGSSEEEGEVGTEASSGGGEETSDPPPASLAVGWASVPAEGVDGTIGGVLGPTIAVQTREELEAATAGDEPAIIEIVAPLVGHVVVTGNNKTILGRPDTVLEGGITLDGTVDAPVYNIILRDVRIIAPPCEGECSDVDALGLRWAHHVWIDHVDLIDGSDGNLDITRESDYVTVSWTRFFYRDPERELRQSNLVGGADEHVEDIDDLRVTFHHNWWTENVDKSMPRARFGEVHLFNNYYTAIENSDCIRADLESNLVIEANVFDGSDEPLGADIHETAILGVRGNLAIPEPLYDLEIGEPFVPPYPYVLDDVAVLPDLVREQAGPTWAAGALP